MIKSLQSIVFQEGIINFIKRKRNITFLDNRTLFEIKYNNRLVKIFLNKKFGYVDKYIYDFGIYEKDIIDSIRKELTPEMTMLDIGGNIGQHSLILAPYCKQIFAFEPIPEIYEEFSNSIKANSYKNIFLKNCAIGNKKETKEFYFNVANTGASSFIKNNNNSKKLSVEIELLKNALPKNQKFDIVKIDVEGYEAVVILGNKEIFLENRPIIFLEFAPSSINSEGTYNCQELLTFFFENNYEIYSKTLNKTFTQNGPELLITDDLIIKPL